MRDYDDVAFGFIMGFLIGSMTIVLLFYTASFLLKEV